MADELSDIVKLLFAELKDLKNSFNSLIIASTASLVIVFGWFMTSSTAQGLIKSSPTTAWMVSAGLILSFISLTYVHWRAWSNSQKIKTFLSETKGFSCDDYFRHQVINAKTIIIMELTQLALIVFFIIVIHDIPKLPQANH